MLNGNSADFRVSLQKGLMELRGTLGTRGSVPLTVLQLGYQLRPQQVKDTIPTIVGSQRQRAG